MAIEHQEVCDFNPPADVEKTVKRGETELGEKAKAGIRRRRALLAESAQEGLLNAPISAINQGKSIPVDALGEIISKWDDEDYGYTGEEGEPLEIPAEWPEFAGAFDSVSLANRQEQRRIQDHLPSLDLGPTKINT